MGKKMLVTSTSIILHNVFYPTKYRNRVVPYTTFDLSSINALNLVESKKLFRVEKN